MKKLLAAICLLVTVACTSIPNKTESDIEGLAAALGINASEILYKDAASYTITAPGEKYAHFKLGMYVQTSDQIMFTRYSEKTGELLNDVKLPFSAISYSGVATRGMFNHLQQLRFLALDKVVSVNFSNSSDAEAGYKDRTQLAVTKLEEMGVVVKEDATWVYPNAAKDLIIFIPLIIN